MGRTIDDNLNQSVKQLQTAEGGVTFKKGDDGDQGRQRTQDNVAGDAVDLASPVNHIQVQITGRAAVASQGSLASGAAVTVQLSIASVPSQGSVAPNFDSTRASVASNGSIASVASRTGFVPSASIASNGTLASVAATYSLPSQASSASAGSNAGFTGVASTAAAASMASRPNITAEASVGNLGGFDGIPARVSHAIQASQGAVTSIALRDARHQVDWAQ